MSVSSLSESTQNYLKAIWSLTEWSEDRVTTSTLAGRVGVKLSTASDAVRKLAEQGLVVHEPYGAITLTAQGRGHAIEMIRRHRLVETFLVEVLGYRWDQVHEEAEVLEHAISDFMVARIDEHLGFPSHDPHGDPIPSAKGKIPKSSAQPLHRLGAGTRCRVDRIADDDPALLQYFAEQGIGVGTVLETLPPAPFSDAVEVRVEGRDARLTLGRAASQAVWVR